MLTATAKEMGGNRIGMNRSMLMSDRPHQIPNVSLDHLKRVFCGEGADLEPEDFRRVAVLVNHEVSRHRTR